MYAKETTVPVERSRAEIEETLRRYGAAQFVSGWTAESAVIGFQAHNRVLKFVLAYPHRSDKRFTTKKSRGGCRVDCTEAQAVKAYDAEIRRLWRALALVIKAKLEAVQSGIATFEEEFLPHIVIPGTNQTMAEILVPQLDEAYRTGRMPALLPYYPVKDIKE